MAGLFDDEIVPIPDCTEFIEHFGKERGYDTPARVASEMLREAREWRRKHPGRDVMEIVTSPWQGYIRANI